MFRTHAAIMREIQATIQQRDKGVERRLSEEQNWASSLMGIKLNPI